MARVEPINLAAKLATFAEHWQPRIVGELNGQHVKLVKFQGAFVWHHHDDEGQLPTAKAVGLQLDREGPSRAAR